MRAADRKPVSNTRRIVAMQFCQHATQEFHGEYCDRCLQRADETLSALDAAGYAVVPKHPTIEMFNRGFNMTRDGHGVSEVYKAMLTAAKETT